MTQPIAITFPNMPPSAWIEGEIRKRAERLDSLCPGILSCHVVADVPHRHHQRGNKVRLLLTLRVRGEEISVSRAGAPATFRRVIREAFDLARRRLQVHQSLQRDLKRRTATVRKLAQRNDSAA